MIKNSIIAIIVILILLILVLFIQSHNHQTPYITENLAPIDSGGSSNDNKFGCNRFGIGREWEKTCVNGHYTDNNRILNAVCRTNVGNYVDSSIDINTCEKLGCNIYNNNGKLECGNPSSSGIQPSSAGVQPSSAGIQPSSSGIQPSSAGVQPSSSGLQPWPEPRCLNPAAGPWQKTCKDIIFDSNSGILAAQCQTSNGDYVGSIINADACGKDCYVHNNNGRLQCGLDAPVGPPNIPSPPPNIQPPSIQPPSTQPSDSKCFYPQGTWNKTCTNPKFNPFTGILSSQCQNKEGNYVLTSINVNMCAPQNFELYNDNGQLQCGHPSDQCAPVSPPTMSPPTMSPPTMSPPTMSPPTITPSCNMANGSWSRTCRNSSINAKPGTTTLTAECQTLQGNYRPTSINIETCASKNCNVLNNNGRLQCGY
jgi:hypothetical protein